MPGLEEMNDSIMVNGNQKRTMTELEPAFLREEDYPPGWMVYDQEVGVILKTEADKLKEKRQQQCSKENVRNEETVCITKVAGEETVSMSESQPMEENAVRQTESESSQIPVTTEETECGTEVKPEQSPDTRCRTDLKPPADQSPAIAAT
jgi:hypothetical protein